MDGNYEVYQRRLERKSPEELLETYRRYIVSFERQHQQYMLEMAELAKGEILRRLNAQKNTSNNDYQSHNYDALTSFFDV